jgi:regulator of protease activity HflC (stomatin/prohibitin superfamily)
MTWFTIFVVVLIVLLMNTAIVVPARETWVKERLGKYAGTLPPGFHILIPLIDRVPYRHDMREQIIDVSPQSCITRDNMQVEVDGILYLKVMDPVKASYGIERYRLAAVNLAQTTMRSEIGKLSLHESFSERERLNHTIVGEIDKASQSWGIKVMRYEIMNINPSPEVVHTLEKQMVAERTRRAEVTMATAEKQALFALSEGERQEAINLSEGEKQRRINEAEGKASEISIVAEAVAFSVARVAQAIQKPSGNAAVRMRIIERYLEELGNILQKSRVVVVPQGIAAIKGFFEGMSALTDTMSGDGKTITPAPTPKTEARPRGGRIS